MTQTEAIPDCRLYLISPPAIDVKPFAATLREALCGGDVACFQLRLKNCTDDEIRTAVETLMPLCHEFDVAFILNDRPDLAAALGCDGVHIGQEDADYETARNAMGPDHIIGVTCHNSRHLAMIAGEQGADYVAFGAFFHTDTKKPATTASVDLLSWWQEIMEIPCVAIGGITAQNCASLVRAGADFIAISAGVWDHAEGPKQAVTQINRSIADALPER